MTQHKYLISGGQQHLSVFGQLNVNVTETTSTLQPWSDSVRRLLTSLTARTQLCSKRLVISFTTRRRLSLQRLVMPFTARSNIVRSGWRILFGARCHTCTVFLGIPSWWECFYFIFSDEQLCNIFSDSPETTAFENLEALACDLWGPGLWPFNQTANIFSWRSLLVGMLLVKPLTTADWQPCLAFPSGGSVSVW